MKIENYGIFLDVGWIIDIDFLFLDFRLGGKDISLKLVLFFCFSVFLDSVVGISD